MDGMLSAFAADAPSGFSARGDSPEAPNKSGLTSASPSVGPFGTAPLSSSGEPPSAGVDGEIASSLAAATAALLSPGREASPNSMARRLSWPPSSQNDQGPRWSWSMTQGDQQGGSRGIPVVGGGGQEGPSWSTQGTSFSLSRDAAAQVLSAQGIAAIGAGGGGGANQSHETWAPGGGENGAGQSPLSMWRSTYGNGNSNGNGNKFGGGDLNDFAPKADASRLIRERHAEISRGGGDHGGHGGHGASSGGRGGQGSGLGAGDVRGHALGNDRGIQGPGAGAGAGTTDDARLGLGVDEDGNMPSPNTDLLFRELNAATSNLSIAQTITMATEEGTWKARPSVMTAGNGAHGGEGTAGSPPDELWIAGAGPAEGGPHVGAHNDLGDDGSGLPMNQFGHPLQPGDMAGMAPPEEGGNLIINYLPPRFTKHDLKNVFDVSRACEERRASGWEEGVFGKREWGASVCACAM